MSRVIFARYVRPVCRNYVPDCSVRGKIGPLRANCATSASRSQLALVSCFSGRLDGLKVSRGVKLRDLSQRRWKSKRGVHCSASPWTEERSPYETLGVDEGATEDVIKSAYRKMAKIYHPDVYDGSAELAEGETAESRFIQVQAAYELLTDTEERRKYDIENRKNPMRASQAWAEWILKKKKAFNQRGDLAVASWSEQMQREANLRARNLSKAKIDPEEERRLLEKERQASMQQFETTMRRHHLVLRKRDLMRKKSSKESQKQLVAELLALEGLELDDSE